MHNRVTRCKYVQVRLQGELSSELDYMHTRRKIKVITSSALVYHERSLYLCIAYYVYNMMCAVSM